ncbi:amidohydrolase family protein [Bremerella sp. P1]|uniref:amidohydrolase family protein n=1 Tax=Bremerella sp. P1 TaxID=3026424 RepID=UPI002368C8B0|nr:amidohydrolase family protein [Bremerella sp. P1]WDI41668.1 amidohydrolase family protein [Bremerella sp. P1]
MNNTSVSKQLSRRQVIQAAAVAAMASSNPIWASESQKNRWIDAHVHIWTPDTQAYPLAHGFSKTDMVPTSFTPDELFAECHPVGVDRVVLIQMSFYKFDNRYMLDAIAEYPNTFRGVGIVDHQQASAAATMKSLHKQGVTGFRLYANAESAASWIDSPEMSVMWKTAGDTGQAICLLANPDALPAIEKLCRKFPKTRVVVDHFGRIGVDGSMRAKDLTNLCRLADLPEVFIKTSAFYALGEKKPPYVDLTSMIRQLHATFGPQRLMWASDCPYQVQGSHTYAASIELIRDRLDFLTDEDKSWILQKTAQKVYWSAS